MGFETKDSGERQTFDTGAKRDTQEGKGLYSALPFHAIKRLADLYERGAQKYSKDNWRKGMPMSRFADSALRHLCQYLEGNREEDHLGATIWNVAAMIETEVAVQRGLLPTTLLDLITPYNPNSNTAQIVALDRSSVWLIDREDLPLLASHAWNNVSGRPYTLIKNKLVPMESLILQNLPEQYELNFTNRNIFDYTKQNLYIS